MRSALITGITGQDGSYLAELLLEKGYRVHGVVRRSSSENTGRLTGMLANAATSDTRLHLHSGDLTDGAGLRRILQTVEPDEVYNLGAQSHVRISFEQPEHTAQVIALGTLRFLEAFRDYRDHSRRRVKFYQAGSSEMFGGSPPPQNEASNFCPRSPYAVSKVAAHHYAVNYREAYTLDICNGILFNHESPRRGETFVTRKITRAATRIKLGLQDKLLLGNLDAYRDWGYAADYVEAMWLMLQQAEPSDFVVATGRSRSVREFVEVAFGYVGLDWRQYVVLDPGLLRPTEVEHLRGDPTKCQKDLGWVARVGFEELVKLMVDADLVLASREKQLQDGAGRTNP